MKTAKKLTALLIVLTLIFALSATAFAFDPQTQYRIKFFVNGTEMNTWEIIGNAGDSVYTSILANGNPRNADFDPVPDYYNPSIMRQALISLEGYGSTPGSDDDVPSAIINQYPNITAVTGRDGYYLLETGQQGYHYFYVGRDWVYRYEGGGDLYIYMDQCFPAANDVMEVSYGLQTSDWWQANPLA